MKWSTRWANIVNISSGNENEYMFNKIINLHSCTSINAKMFQFIEDGPIKTVVREVKVFLCIIKCELVLDLHYIGYITFFRGCTMFYVVFIIRWNYDY